MQKTPGILGLATVVVLAAAWWGVRSEEPSGPPETSPVLAPPAAAELPPPAPEVANAPTLVGAPDAEPAAAPGEALRRTGITGRVVRLGSRAPVWAASMSLRLDGRVLTRTHSASDGRFRLEADLPVASPSKDESLTLVAAAEGLTTLQALAPSRGSETSLDVGDLVLEPALTIGGAVRGEDGERVAGARITIEPDAPAADAMHRAGTWAEAALRRQTESDADGCFEVSGLPRRRFDVEVLAEGYVSAWFRGRAVADGAWLDLRLLRGQSVCVRVLGMNGLPVPDARVNLYLGYRRTFAGHYKTFLRLDRSAMTDASGRCVLTGLRDRNHHIVAERGGLAGGDTYVLPGWPETVVRLTPGWRSTRYMYEDGPGGWGRSSRMPPGLGGRFDWVRRPPKPEAEPPPAAPLPERTEPPAPEEPDDEEAPEARPAPPPDRARLHVTILSADGVPMPRTYARFQGPDDEAVITEDDGTDFVSLAPGRYEVRVSPLDFGSPAADVHETVDAQGGVESRFVFRMPRVYSVSIQVQAADGTPVPRAQLEILRGDDTKRCWADDQGRVALFAEKGQPFALLSQPDGEPAAFLEDVELPVSGPVVLRALPPARLEGRVLGPEGTPVFGAFVEACREGLGDVGEEEWRTWTDDRGAFVLEGPAEAAYEVRARHRAFGATVVRVEIGPGTDAIALRLLPLARLRGRLVDEEGEPIPGGEIEVRGAKRGQGYGWVGSGEDGRFEIALPLGDASIRLRVRCEGYATRFVPVPAGASGELEVRLASE